MGDHQGTLQNKSSTALEEKEEMRRSYDKPCSQTTKCPEKVLKKNFESLFTKPAFISFCIYFQGLFIELKRTNMQSITFKAPQACYENIQYSITFYM